MKPVQWKPDDKALTSVLLRYEGCLLHRNQNHPEFSYFLILFLSIPVILETKYVLSLWLGQVPEYTLIFVRLVIVNTLIDSFTYIIGATVQATGRIKKYQLCVGGILLLNLPLSYF